MVMGDRVEEVARTLGRWTAHARSYVRNLSTELERETGRELDDAARAVREAASGVKEDLRKLGDAASGADRERKPGSDS